MVYNWYDLFQFLVDEMAQEVELAHASVQFSIFSSQDLFVDSSANTIVTRPV